jgi:dihydrofolate reductase
LGRKTYEEFVGYWPAATTDKEIIADKLNEIPKLVFSKTLTSAPWGKWSPATVVSKDAVSAVRELKSMPGKNIILWGSLSLAAVLMEADLIDQYRIQLCPTAVGGGRALFPKLEQYKSMKLVEQGATPSGVAYLYYNRA